MSEQPSERGEALGLAWVRAVRRAMTELTPFQVRPTGVTVLAVLSLVAGALAVLAGIGLIFAGALFAGLGDPSGLGLLGAFGAAAGVALLLYAAFVFAVGYGLLKRQRWAWYATLVLAALQVLGALVSLLSGDIMSALVSLAIAGVVGWYLLSPPVQGWFGVSHKVPWTYRPARPA